jgi:hypothetical protein
VRYKRLEIIPSSFWLAVFFLFIQQLIVASSSIWITRLILHISEERPSLIWLWLYLGSLILPYLPGALALVEISKAKAMASVNYVHKFAALFPGKIVTWSSHDQQAAKSSLLSGEAYPTITGFIDYFYHLSASSLNVIFNLIAFAILIDPNFILSCVIGMFLSSLILLFQKHTRTRLALKAQQSRIKWTSLLLKAWDNILLSNQYNLKIWKDKAKERGNRLIGKTIELEKFSQSISIGMAFALMGPSILLVIYLGMKHVQDLAFLAILTVLLPRLFQILTYSYETLFLLSDFPMQKAKLNTVLSVLDTEKYEENREILENRIDLKKIAATKKKASQKIPINNLLEELPTKGRITLLGENGSGKTSLLLSIKMKHGDEAFYLPSKHDLIFKTSKSHMSTGQHSRKILQELEANVSVPIFLLDEWDANLDKKNREEISNLIDELSLNHCIIESIHLKHAESSFLDF